MTQCFIKYFVSCYELLIYYFFFTWYQFIIYIYIVAVQKIPELKDELKSVKDELKAVKDELKLAKDELKAELKAEVFMKSSSIGIYWF